MQVNTQKLKNISCSQRVFCAYKCSLCNHCICPLMTNLSLHIKQDGPDTGTNYREDKEIFEISAKGAIVFIIVASVFLLLLFYFMSSWFVWVLIVLFCIGGIEVFPPFRHRNSSIFVLVHVDMYFSLLLGSSALSLMVIFSCRVCMFAWSRF